MSKSRKYLAALASLSVLNNASSSIKSISKDEMTPRSEQSVFEFSQTSYFVNEDAGLAHVYVERRSCSSGDPAASVNFQATDGSAVAGEDYSAVNGTLTWGSSGDCLLKEFTVPIIDDGFTENTESINLSLSDPVGGTVGSSGMATLYIRENDGDKVDFASNGVKILEGESAAVVYVERTSCGSSGVAGAASVDYYSLDGTAAAGQDYVAVNGTLTWASSGDCGLKSFLVPILEDTGPEPTETVYLMLDNPVGTSIGSSGAFSILEILDNNATDKSFESQMAVYMEQDGLVPLYVDRKHCTDESGPARIDIDVSDGSATYAQDYQQVGTTLTWGSSGDCASKVFWVPLYDDLVGEQTETTIVSLSQAADTTVSSSGGYMSNLLYILDDENPIESDVAVSEPFPFMDKDVIAACDSVYTVANTVTISSGIDGTFMAPHVSIRDGFRVNEGGVFRVVSEDLSSYCVKRLKEDDQSSE